MQSSFYQLYVYMLAALAACDRLTTRCDNGTAGDQIISLPSALVPKPFNKLYNTTATVYLICRNDESCLYRITDGLIGQGAQVLHHNHTGPDECDRKKHMLIKGISGIWTLDNYEKLYIGRGPPQPDEEMPEKPIMGKESVTTMREFPFPPSWAVYTNIDPEYLSQRCAQYNPYWPINATIKSS